MAIAFCPKLDGWRMIVARKDLHRGNKKMKQISRRGFVKATGALAIPPALASLAATTARAQQNNNTADLRVDSNIVFGKGGDIDLLLDVYHPPTGVTPKKMAM